MSLVHYDFSDDEESEDQIEQKSNHFDSSLIKSKEEKSKSNEKNHNDEYQNYNQPSNSTFSSLNLSNSIKKLDRRRVQIKAFNDELIVNPDSDSDEEKNERKRLKKSEKGSNLISMLPKPKNIKSKLQSNTSLTSLVPTSVANHKNVKNSSEISSKNLENKNISKNFFLMDDDDDDDDDYGADQYPSKINSLSDEQLMYNKLDVSKENIESVPIYGPSKPPENSEDIAPTYIDPNDDVTYKKYIASKFDDPDINNIKIVDVNLSQHLSENKEWLKNISLEKDIYEKDLEAIAPNSIARRKNQITFLAYQAKKHELQLKNQWAKNRLSKSQTRAKYGF